MIRFVAGYPDCRISGAMKEETMLTEVRTETWTRGFELESTARADDWGDETEVDLVPAGALAPTATLPPFEPIPGLGLTLFD